MGDFNFTWGMAQKILNELGYIQITGFMLDAYIELGLTRDEFLCIIHLARFHYNSPEGEARPSAATIAQAMGYSHPNSVRTLIKSLEDKKMLTVTRQIGKASIYDATPFAHAAFAIYKRTLTSQCEGTLTSQGEGTLTFQEGTLTPQSEGPSHPNVTEEKKRKGNKKEKEEDLQPSFYITPTGIKVEY